MRLIKMTDFVLGILSQDRPCDRGRMLDEIGAYAQFLRRPLTLDMFIGDEALFEGFILDEHGLSTKYWVISILEDIEDLELYTIEDLVEYDLTLTQKAIKQLGL